MRATGWPDIILTGASRNKLGVLILIYRHPVQWAPRNLYPNFKTLTFH